MAVLLWLFSQNFDRDLTQFLFCLLPHGMRRLDQLIRADWWITVNEMRARVGSGCQCTGNNVFIPRVQQCVLGGFHGCSRRTKRTTGGMSVRTCWTGMRPKVTHISVATLKSTNPSTNCADINCIGSINVHQAPVNVDWFNFFCMEEFNDASLLLTHINDRVCFLTVSPATSATER